jgi:cell division protein ZapB
VCACIHLWSRESNVAGHQQVAADLSRAREENETLQLGLMEQEELQGAAAARIQALVDRATAVSA